MTYSLGSEDAEVARLEMQAEFLRRPTQVLLEASGICSGMRVLDLGTGVGHVATAVAEMVGVEGEVVGLDIDPRMIERARTRARDFPQVRFIEADVTRWRDERAFDAVVGRLIFFHLPEPIAVLRSQLKAVRRGGRVIVLDYDIGGLRAEPPNDFVDEMASLMMAAFRCAGADPTIGSRLRHILTESGVEDVEGFGVSEYLAHDDPVGPGMLSGVIRSLSPLIVAHGLATEAELDLATLAPRAAHALRSTTSALVPPTLVGAWGRCP